jgi:predicted unusual protein kinase regulating ubiquinone biosynthesis (AarF/ABC1/UbiB family)
VARRKLGGRIKRGSRLARTGLRGATGVAGAAARRVTGLPPNEDQHEQMAEHLAEVLGDMKGAAMKLGQLLSFVDLDVPPEVRTVYHHALAKLREDAIGGLRSHNHRLRALVLSDKRRRRL